MKEEQIKILQTAILLIDEGDNLVLENDLLPYLKKAQEIKKVINS